MHYYYLIGTVFLLIAAIILYLTVSETRITKKEHDLTVNAVKSASSQILDIVTKERDELRNKLNNVQIQNRIKAKLVRESVYYDKENLTFVTADNLVRICEV